MSTDKLQAIPRGARQCEYVLKDGTGSWLRCTEEATLRLMRDGLDVPVLVTHADLHRRAADAVASRGCPGDQDEAPGRTAAMTVARG